MPAAIAQPRMASVIRAGFLLAVSALIVSRAGKISLIAFSPISLSEARPGRGFRQLDAPRYGR